MSIDAQLEAVGVLDCARIRQSLSLPDTSPDAWMQLVRMSLSPFGDVLVAATKRRFIVLRPQPSHSGATAEPPSSSSSSSSPANAGAGAGAGAGAHAGAMRFAVVASGSECAGLDDFITAVLVLPMSVPLASSHSGHTQQHYGADQRVRDTVVVVGYSSGYVRFFTDRGELVMSQLLHSAPVVQIKLRTTYRRREMNDDLTVLFPGTAVSIDGFSLLQSLLACIGQLSAGANSAAAQVASTLPAGSAAIAYKKWNFNQQEETCDLVSCALEAPNAYDHLMSMSVGAMHPVHRYITVGKLPMIGLYSTTEGQRPFFSAVALASSVASTLTSAVFSFAKNWWGGGSTQQQQQQQHHQQQQQQQQPPVIEQGSLLPLRSSISDPRRRIASIQLDPSGTLAVTTDGFGRVMLLDVADATIVRMWKGYRDAQCGWIEVDEFIADEELVHGQQQRAACRASFLCIYAPRRGLLEVWAMRYGPRVKAFNVGPHGTLLSAGYQTLGAPLGVSVSSDEAAGSGGAAPSAASALDRLLVRQQQDGGVLASMASSPSLVACSSRSVFVAADGTVFDIVVPFHCAADGQDTRRRDQQILRQLMRQVSLAESSNPAASLQQVADVNDEYIAADGSVFCPLPAEAAILDLIKSLHGAESLQEALTFLVQPFLRVSFLVAATELVLSMITTLFHRQDETHGSPASGKLAGGQPGAQPPSPSGGSVSFSPEQFAVVSQQVLSRLSLLRSYQVLVQLAGAVPANTTRSAPDKQHLLEAIAVLELSPAHAEHFVDMLAFAVAVEHEQHGSVTDVAIPDLLAPSEYLACFKTLPPTTGVQTGSADLLAAVQPDLSDTLRLRLATTLFHHLLLGQWSASNLRAVLGAVPVAPIELLALFLAFVLHCVPRVERIARHPTVERLHTVVGALLATASSSAASTAATSHAKSNPLLSQSQLWWRGLFNTLERSPNLANALIIAHIARSLIQDISGVASDVPSSPLSAPANGQTTSPPELTLHAWSQLCARLEDAVLLRAGVSPAVVQAFCGASALSVFYLRDNGSVVELLALQCVALGLDVDELVDLFQRGHVATGAAAASSASSTAEPSASAVQLTLRPEDGLARSLLRRMLEHFGASILPAELLAHIGWMLVQQWTREGQDQIDRLERALQCFTAITSPRVVALQASFSQSTHAAAQQQCCKLASSMLQLVWDASLSKVFGALVALMDKVGKCPKERLLQKALDMSSNSTICFVRCCRTVSLLLIERLADEGIKPSAAVVQVTGQFQMDYHTGAVSLSPLAASATNQKSATTDLGKPPAAAAVSPAVGPMTVSGMLPTLGATRLRPEWQLTKADRTCIVARALNLGSTVARSPAGMNLLAMHILLLDSALCVLEADMRMVSPLRLLTEESRRALLRALSAKLATADDLAVFSLQSVTAVDRSRDADVFQSRQVFIAQALKRAARPDLVSLVMTLPSRFGMDPDEFQRQRVCDMYRQGLDGSGEEAARQVVHKAKLGTALLGIAASRTVRFLTMGTPAQNMARVSCFPHEVHSWVCSVNDADSREGTDDGLDAVLADDSALPKLRALVSLCVSLLPAGSADSQMSRRLLSALESLR
ncbi:hypothetical protein CAOG_06293 [Capsaspora owczarzaki ATCC 30864]|uniref:Rab3-GAP regulatory subunit N-terminal domain-containing protein n=1 Tax=Capsaspora owczarzaki (strain ATCC 30864) TaxID=595528 RepID=A0A0D2X4E1_CAPO3|nr:hypothetical protein CAOG_06293 [Capsaspora owczarzaki ATCC 30864]KJE95899.1 hypothetical protein CAOG_006293 [Capsaspora owczarzaki ATCC 30864]|eukprot:XP_004345042.2 hypothetical protein CAOG_06293 [Capsaspora owczarzaki ATCC 30864]